MLSPADELAMLPEKDQQEFLSTLSEEQAEALMYDWEGFLARPDQIEPDGEWDIWLPLAGRGWGKTRVGSEWTKKVASRPNRRIALIAETAADARDVMVEGESGILNVYGPNDPNKPTYEPSKRRLTWPNGSVATLFNAVEPEQLRGPQFTEAWLDELAKFKYARDVWDNLQFGLRLGDNPRQLITTTPKPTELIKAIVAGQEGRVHLTRGSTKDNMHNLSKRFLERVVERYQGTRKGRQELDAEILSDLPGALWPQAVIDTYRLRDVELPQFERVVVAVDPAVELGVDDQNEHGIIVAGITGGQEKSGFILEDASMAGTPAEWSRRVAAMFEKWQADAVIAETNQGGQMVAHTIRSVSPNIPVKQVKATRGKHVRAEPIASLYEQGRIRHVGSFPELEDQMTQFTTEGYQGDKSPDRADALVWACTDLFPQIAIKEPPKQVFVQPIKNPVARSNRFR